MKFNICVNCEKVEVEYSPKTTKVEVTLSGVYFDDIIDEVGEQKALRQFSEGSIRKYVIDNDIDVSD